MITCPSIKPCRILLHIRKHTASLHLIPIDSPENIHWWLVLLVVLIIVVEDHVGVGSLVLSSVSQVIHRGFERTATAELEFVNFVKVLDFIVIVVVNVGLLIGSRHIFSFKSESHLLVNHVLLSCNLHCRLGILLPHGYHGLIAFN